MILGPKQICLNWFQLMKAIHTLSNTDFQTLLYKTVLVISKGNGEIKPQLRFLTLYWYYKRSNEPESITIQADKKSLSSLSYTLYDFWF